MLTALCDFKGRKANFLIPNLHCIEKISKVRLLDNQTERNMRSEMQPMIEKIAESMRQQRLLYA